MPRNVEVKASVRDLEAVRERAEQLSGGPGILLKHEDIFFRVPTGRLKLRLEDEGRGQLIFYERPDSPGPRQSTYWLAGTEAPEALKEVLRRALGVIGAVRKQRTLHMVGQTRVHLDEVEGLGCFVEIEVVVREDQSPEEGAAVARKLMQAMGIGKDDLVEGAYLDLLNARRCDRQDTPQPHGD